MFSIKTLGVDPSFRNFGLCEAEIYVPPSGVLIIKPSRLHLSSTEKSSNKQVRVSSDDLAAAKIQHQIFQEFARRNRVVFAEIPGGSKSSRAAKGSGICIGILAGSPVPVIQVQPDEVKKATVGKKTASKEEMIEWAHALYPDLDWLTKKRGGEVTLTDANEHLADAVATIHAGVKTDQFQQLLTLAGAFTEAA